jgi:hypothetical protein
MHACGDGLHEGGKGVGHQRFCNSRKICQIGVHYAADGPVPTISSFVAHAKSLNPDAVEDLVNAHKAKREGCS